MFISYFVHFLLLIAHFCFNRNVLKLGILIFSLSKIVHIFLLSFDLNMRILFCLSFLIWNHGLLDTFKSSFFHYLFLFTVSHFAFKYFIWNFVASSYLENFSRLMLLELQLLVIQSEMGTESKKLVIWFGRKDNFAYFVWFY